jgi:hypothetical protein
MKRMQKAEQERQEESIALRTPSERLLPGMLPQSEEFHLPEFPSGSSPFLPSHRTVRALNDSTHFLRGSSRHPSRRPEQAQRQ